MNNVGGPLNESETAELEGILLGRDPDETWQHGMDEGVLTLPELDGFLTAIVSGPESLPPSQWLPALWGDFPPSLASPAEANRMLSLMFRHMNGIAAMLMEQPEAFEPIFFQHELAGEVVDIPDEWCEGFMRAVSLAPHAWEAGGSELDSLLDLIVDYTEAGNFRAQTLPRVERDQLCAALPDAIRAIHAFWLARRAPLQPRRNQGPVAGRNDPCPCGSGRKFKKCCLQ